MTIQEMLERMVTGQPLRSQQAPSRRKKGNSDVLAVEQFLANLPSCEPWLENNLVAKASVERGLEQAAQGQGSYKGSFAQYVDLEIEDED